MVVSQVHKTRSTRLRTIQSKREKEKGKNGKGNFIVNFDNEIEFNRINKLLNDKQ